MMSRVDMVAFLDGGQCSGTATTWTKSASTSAMAATTIGRWRPSRRPVTRSEVTCRLFRELLRYVDAGTCRHDFILRHFGDH